MDLVYFSTKSKNTHRFVSKLGYPAHRIPINGNEEMVEQTAPYILFLATYSNNKGEGAIAPQILKFLEYKENAKFLKGIVGSGNMNFGRNYCLAAEIVSQRYNVPVLYRFELLGMREDVEAVKEIIQDLIEAENE